eukprot:14795185-Heterocapsa_arctica.AAC.1
MDGMTNIIAASRRSYGCLAHDIHHGGRGCIQARQGATHVHLSPMGWSSCPYGLAIHLRSVVMV